MCWPDMQSGLLERFALPGGDAAQVEWRRSPRARRVSLRIDPRGGSVVVTLPPRAARSAGVALLLTHAAWVSDRLAALPEAIPLQNGAMIPLHGVPHRIRSVPDAKRGVWLTGNEILVSGDPEFLPRRVLDFLRAEARRRLTALVAEKTVAAGLTARRITIKDTRSRWGSCATDGALAFSWRLVLAPPSVQDYVAAHEVAHLRHMNHGPRFWALVARLTPHAATAIPWLRTEGARLLRVG